MSIAEWFGMSVTDTEPAFQLGARQWETWAKMTEAQRTEANQIMATRVTASKAIAQARKAGA